MFSKYAPNISQIQCIQSKECSIKSANVNHVSSNQPYNLVNDQDFHYKHLTDVYHVQVHTRSQTPLFSIRLAHNFKMSSISQFIDQSQVGVGDGKPGINTEERILE